MNLPNSYNQYLRSAKRLYKQENSFPSVYRYLIRTIDPDIAIAIIHDLQKLNMNNEDATVVN